MLSRNEGEHLHIVVDQQRGARDRELLLREAPKAVADRVDAITAIIANPACHRASEQQSVLEPQAFAGAIEPWSRSPMKYVA